ncbi:substrate-binding periplasmic protein [Nocardia sp. IBHARD005]|uniref:substrate-binding periplasmic protein n=1 Tax=Nocardia sp. IBHARD005 TaxID=3457765 RepID=UPI004058B3E4
MPQGDPVKTLAELRRLGRARSTAIGFIVVVLVIGSMAAACRLNYSSLLPTRKVAIATGEWGPMVVRTDSTGGPTIRFAASVLGSAGFDPVVSFATWETAYSRVERGEAFAAVPVVSSATRLRDFTLSAPFLSVEYRIFYNRARMNGDSISATELREKKTAFLAGYDYWPSASSDFQNVALDKFGNKYSAHAAFEALRDGTVDLVLEGLEQGRYITQSDRFAGDSAQFGTIPPMRSNQLGFPVSDQAPLHFLFSRSMDPRVVEKVNSAIIRFRGTDEYHELEMASLGCLNTKAAWNEDVDPVPLRSTSGSTFTVTEGTEVRVIVWGGQDTRCPAAATIPLPAGFALAKIWSGPDKGILSVVPVSSLKTGE